MAERTQGKRKYRIVYQEGSTAPVLEPVPKPKPERPKRTREQQERLRRKQSIARNNQRHALSFNRSYLIFLTAATILCAVFCGVYVQKRFARTNHIETTAALQSELTTAKAENDALESQISTAVNLETIKKSAKKLGMSYPSEGQTKYFKIQDDDYMTQLEQ